MSSAAARLNALPAREARGALLHCCGSRAWADRMLSARPFEDDEALLEAAARIWWALEPEDWREAFSRHPRIGERELDDSTRSGAWSRQEQSGVEGASEDVRAALHEGNRAYEARFGHVFLIRAAGRGAREMLAELRRRLANDAEDELWEAAREQLEIASLRLRKLGSDSADRERTEKGGVRMGAITTHVLDLAGGRPAAGILIALETQEPEGGWTELGAARTDSDGRAGDFLPEGSEPSPGIYRLRFRTAPYFEEQGLDPFHPYVEISFRLSRAGEHYHVPLLLAPFGYTTYRGS